MCEVTVCWYGLSVTVVYRVRGKAEVMTGRQHAALSFFTSGIQMNGHAAEVSPSVEFRRPYDSKTERNESILGGM